MIQYLEACEKTNKEEPGLGWYHSHPGYGCWLSGIDVDTQNFNQKFQDPWLAIVVDPVRTIAQGKVQLGAFRTYPDDFKPSEGESSWQSVPLDKIKDFGVRREKVSFVVLTFFFFRCTRIGTISWRCRTSSRSWTATCWSCCGPSTGSTRWPPTRSRPPRAT
jgi:proteasome lid subunit RPN8/RPN11